MTAGDDRWTILAGTCRTKKGQVGIGTAVGVAGNSRMSSQGTKLLENSYTGRARGGSDAGSEWLAEEEQPKGRAPGGAGCGLVKSW